jgi:hypothetical protein
LIRFEQKEDLKGKEEEQGRTGTKEDVKEKIRYASSTVWLHKDCHHPTLTVRNTLRTLDNLQSH